MGRLERFSLPLLAKELVELSGRPRTYIVRVTYATLLLVICWLILYSNSPVVGTSPLDALGMGRPVLQAVGYLQNISMLLLLPALACGAFTIEKERNTLSLLLLTRLGPWTILFEKLLSRIILTVCFLIISFPILAFCYSLGGITTDELYAQFLSLLVNSITIICIAVMCSTYFRTTTGALIASYAGLFLLRLGLTVAVATLMAARSGTVVPEEVVFGLMFLGGFSTAVVNWGVNSNLLAAAIISIPWLIISAFCVLFARWFLVSRAFLAPRNVLKEFFRRLDRLLDSANNNSLTRGIVLLRATARLPSNDPVAWRETTTRSLGQVRYLVRILLALEGPVVVLLLYTMLIGAEHLTIGTAALIEVAVWLGMTLVTCVLSASLISGERTRQTLDVLLTTPLNARDIVKEKLAGIERLIWICEVPLWTVVIVRCLYDQGLPFVLCQASMLLIYPRQIAWFAMWFSLSGKSTLVAVVKSLLALLCLCVGPYLVVAAVMMTAMFMTGFQGPDEGFVEFVSAIAYFSPITMFFVSEFNPTNSNFDNGPVMMHPMVGLFVNSLIHGGFLFWARMRCLERADQLLGRSRVSMSFARELALAEQEEPATPNVNSV